MKMLLARLVGKKPTTTPIRVEVFTRAQCSCCDKAMEVLKPFTRRFSLTIETIDVDADSVLKEKYDLLVPVVVINGRERFRGSINPILLERILWSEGRGD
ncbi:MAG: hypothetical protein NVSMB14_11200 [Isosphaeraceae bacterium]